MTLEAPPPTPSPFRISGRTGGYVLSQDKFFLNHWAVARHGRMEINDDLLIDLEAGPATGQLEILDTGSDLALMLCPADGKSVPVADAFADIRFKESPYTVTTEAMVLSQTTKPPPCP